MICHRKDKCTAEFPYGEPDFLQPLRLKPYPKRKSKHKCKFFPTGEKIGSFDNIPRGTTYEYAEFMELTMGKTKEVVKYKWVCECGKTKWVKEK